MVVTCKNCQHVFEGRFCNNCGQSANTERIDFKFLLHHLQSGIFHINKGFFYSLRELYTRPGHTIREYIEGKRIKHFPPVLLLVILATLYGLLHSLGITVSLGLQGSEGNLPSGTLLSDWIYNHYSWVVLATIPFYTVGTYISFGKQGYNFVEYMVLNMFKSAQRIVLHIVTIPVLYYFNGSPTFSKLFAVVYVADLGLIFWTNLQFFNKLTKAKAFWLSVWSHLIFLGCLLVFIFIVALCMQIGK